MRYSLQNMPKRRASLRPWFANFVLKITGSRLTSTCETNGQFRFKVWAKRQSQPRRTESPKYHPGERPFRRNACQPSGENAKRLTWPFVLVNSRNAAPACPCPLSAFQSCHSSSIGMPVAPLSPAAAGSLSQVAPWGPPSTPKEREYA
jgi:hypothetical protein